MEVNKSEAERCRDMGAAALRRGEFERAQKLLKKSLQLYPLGGVEALLEHAKAQQRQQQQQQQKQSSENGSSSSANAGRSNGSTTASTTESSSASLSSEQQQTGADGRNYTEDQVKVVSQVLKAKEGGRGAHYRVLGVNQDASEAQIKKAYRKLSLKVHPDKNAAPHADEAFKAVGLAYATLSDSQKRIIYDRYGEEDPDNRGGGSGRGGMHMRPGQDVSPEEIFNMFFGGGMAGMHGGGPGFHVYTSGFGPGVQFRAGRPQRRGQQQRRQPQQQEGPFPGLGALFQLLPILLIAALSFFKYNEDDIPRGPMPGENKYFSLTSKKPFANQLSTQLTQVKDIPYFVSDRFLQTYYRNRYQLGQVEVMVEKAYEQYLAKECKAETDKRRNLFDQAEAIKDEAEKNRILQQAKATRLLRCDELDDLYPRRKVGNRN